MKTNTNPDIGKLSRFVLSVSSAIFLYFNLVYIYQGWFVRHRADDYCFTGILYEHGFLPGLSIFYTNTSNRFSSFILSALSEAFGFYGIRILILLTIIFILTIVYLCIKRILAKSEVGYSERISFFITNVVAFFLIYLAPNRHQSVYWRSGLVHYFLPLPILLSLCLLISTENKGKNVLFLHEVAIFIIAFINAGLSETAAALQTIISMLYIVYLFLFQKGNGRNTRLVRAFLMFIASLAAMIVMILSPGNALRLKTLEQAPDLITVIRIAVDSAVAFSRISLRGLWLPFGILFALIFVLSLHIIASIQSDLKDIAKRLLFIICSSLLLIVVVCAPTAYGMMAFPEMRVLMLAQAALILTAISLGCLAALVVARIIKPKKVIGTFALMGLLILSFYPLLNWGEQRSELAFYQQRARLWDQSNAVIQDEIKSGKTAITINALDAFAEIAEMRPDKHFWVNVCAAKYYRIDSIIALEN